VNIARTALATIVVSVLTAASLFSEETDKQDLFDAVIVRIVSEYLSYEIDIFNIVFTPEYATDDSWSGSVEVYKHGTLVIRIDSKRRTILTIDERGSTLVFQSTDQISDTSLSGTAWLREYLHARDSIIDKRWLASLHR